MKKTTILALIIIFISFGIAFYFYPKMPSEMASHWNAQGEVDDYMSKFWSLFLMPFVSLGLLVLFLVIPKIDPLKKNIEKFRSYFDNFILLIILFLFYIYCLTVAWNLGYRFSMGKVMLPSLAILFYYAGILIENAKSNWFIGIRTPWTLSNKKVWEETHRMGGKLFKGAALIALLGFLFPEQAIWFVVIPIILASLSSICYSYFLYQKKQKQY